MRILNTHQPAFAHYALIAFLGFGGVTLPVHAIAKSCQQALSKDKPDKLVSWLDKTHTKLSHSLCNQAVSIDRFFGNFEEYTDTQVRSFVRIRNEISWQNLSGINARFKPRVRAKLRLPTIENQLNLLLTDDPIDEDNSITNDIEQNNEPVGDGENFSTALRWTNQNNTQVNTDFDVGARFNDGINGFVRTRFRYIKALNQFNLLRIRQELFWRNQEGFGESTLLRFQFFHSAEFSTESNSQATFSESSKGIDWSQRISLYQQIDPKRAISYNLLAIGYTRPVFLTEDYGISLRYRKNIYRDWLFAELEPELAWPIENNRNITQRIIFRLEIQLGAL